MTACASTKQPRYECFCAVQPSHDTWSLGVVAFEAITGETAVKSASVALACAHGAPYPWERDATEQNPLWLRSRIRAAVEPCLRRDASKRPDIASLHADVARVGQSTAASSGDAS